MKEKKLDRFPVHPTHRHLLASISWEIIASHERRAIKNHSQSLKTLASRGGLSLCEIVAVLEDRPWKRMPLLEALEVIKKYELGLVP
jgi:hypothetical protein